MTDPKLTPQNTALIKQILGNEYYIVDGEPMTTNQGAVKLLNYRAETEHGIKKQYSRDVIFGMGRDNKVRHRKTSLLSFYNIHDLIEVKIHPEVKGKPKQESPLPKSGHDPKIREYAIRLKEEEEGISNREIARRIEQEKQVKVSNQAINNWLAAQKPHRNPTSFREQNEQRLSSREVDPNEGSITG